MAAQAPWQHTAPFGTVPPFVAGKGHKARHCPLPAPRRFPRPQGRREVAPGWGWGRGWGQARLYPAAGGSPVPRCSESWGLSSAEWEGILRRCKRLPRRGASPFPVRMPSTPIRQNLPWKSKAGAENLAMCRPLPCLVCSPPGENGNFSHPPRRSVVCAGLPP